MKSNLSSGNKKNIAETMFRKSLPVVKNCTHLRARATLIKAFINIVESYPSFKAELNDQIVIHANHLTQAFEKNSIKSWQWFEPQLGYNNGILSESLFIAGKYTGNNIYTNKALQSLKFIIGKTFSNNQYMPIGQSSWYKNNEKRSHFDQQPEDPASMILALVTAYKITHDDSLKQLIKICFSWFLGNNSLQESLYNYENGGCFDGLHPDRVNQNQGAESLVSYLMARLAIEKL